MGWDRAKFFIAGWTLMSLVAGTRAAAAVSSPAIGGAEASDARSAAIGCLTSAILHEAGFEPRAGQEAVAEVVLNRLHHPAFPKTVCGVIFQGAERRTGCQFSFTCDGSLRKLLPVAVVSRARGVATEAIDGQLSSHIAGATHYHADYVSPYWAPTLVRVGMIGHHIFYRQSGASPFSAMARYVGSGDRLPASLVGEPSAAESIVRAGSTAGSPKPSQTERFMPWGLAPIAQSAVASKP